VEVNRHPGKPFQIKTMSRTNPGQSPGLTDSLTHSHNPLQIAKITRVNQENAPLALILRTAGTNCDEELAHAFHLAGARTQRLHLNQLIEDPAPLRECQLLGIPGGFSYGDDIAAGRIFGNRLKHRLYDELQAAIERGVPMIAPCNGFQVLVKSGLLPDPKLAKQSTTLDHNTHGRFTDQWSPVTVETQSPCIWTKGLGPTTFDLPIAHGEGRFVADEAELDRLEANHQVALRYADNPNGSARDIAGLTDPTGLILGLMPHPERYLDPTNHPTWTRDMQSDPELMNRSAPGLRMFQNAVNHVTSG